MPPRIHRDQKIFTAKALLDDTTVSVRAVISFIQQSKANMTEPYISIVFSSGVNSEAEPF